MLQWPCCGGSGSCLGCIGGQCRTTCSSDNCEICNDGSCVSRCNSDNCLACDGSGNCVTTCSSDNCEICDGEGSCVSRCSSDDCQTCDGEGHCVYTCDPNNCEVCDGNGNCVSTCIPNNCEVCNGEGSCVSTCDPNNCEVCDGNGNCVYTCDPNSCEVCDGEGNCVSTCDPNSCEVCDGEGNCVSTCDPNSCEECDGEGNCVSRCGECEACDDQGNCDDIEMSNITAVDYACLGCNVTFLIWTSPAEQCDLVNWSGGGNPTSQSGSCGFTTRWDTTGTKTVTASIDDCSISKQKQVTIVKVDKVLINANGGWDDVTGDTIVVLQGSKYTFKALPEPSGSWPSGAPVWSGVTSGTGETLEVTFANSGSYTLTVECGCTDPGKSVIIDVIVPQPEQVSFVDNNPGEEHDIYGITDPVWKRNDPCCYPTSYTMGKHDKTESKFWATKGLTYSTDVHVGLTIDSAAFTNDTSVTFQNWPSETVTNVSADPLPNHIAYVGGAGNWIYKVPSGTDSWISMGTTGPHDTFVVYGTPKCDDANDYTIEHLAWSCYWAQNGVSVTEYDIPKKIQMNCWLNFTMPGHLSDPWDLQTTPGDCQTHAELMAEALKVLGVEADGTTSTTCRVGEWRICPIPTHGLEYHNMVETGGAATNFEGVCEINLIDEATPWKCYYDKAMGAVNGAFQLGSHTNMWTEWNSYPPPHYKVIHHYTYWDNHP